MSKLGKWSPLRIPDAFRMYADETGDSDGPMDAWDPSDWNDPGASGWMDRLTPSHAGQWLIVGAAALFLIGATMWLGKFFTLAHQNPWTLVATLWPASLLLAHVHAREQGFNAVQSLDWAFALTGRNLHVIPGKFVKRFGEGDIQHVAYTPLKSRSYGAFSFNYLKLADLPADREKLMSKARGTNREPDDDARMYFPGPLTGEDSDSVLGRCFGVHGGAPEWHDSGSITDMRIPNPSTLNDDLAGDVLSQLQMYDQRVIPELKSELRTVETQKSRYKQRAEAERDPELDRIFSSIDAISTIVRRDGRGGSEESDSDAADEVTEAARDEVSGR